ncbi:MAG: insulinase family protein [Planctomycetales bacterium]|nr:insulinase family protein [Planctomycetales bacterium]
MANQVFSQQFENGLTLLAEPMDWLESAAFTLLIPAGADRDPKQFAGLSNFVCEMAQRGCGSRSSRQFIEDLELLGVDSSGSVSNAFTSYGGSMPAEKLRDALTIYADVARRPHLNDDQFEDAQQVCIQEVRSHDDDLAHKVMTELRRRRYADPYSRVSYGNIEAIERITLADVQDHFRTFHQPQGAILSVAGKIDWKSLRDHVAELFADWTGTNAPIEETPAQSEIYAHIQHESSQTHLGVTYASVPYSNDDYFQSHGAVGVLSGGMSSRLFTEVREKRGLCYSVYASCETVRDRGAVVSYAGTTTERAQETLDVLVEELLRLREGVREEELQRLKARIKSQLIMAQESSNARSSQIAWDWYHLNRVRTLDELSSIIDALTCQSINQYLVDHPPRDFRVVTLGAAKLEIPRGIS